MKIEGLGQIKATEQIQIIGQPVVRLTNGQILIARIESIQGDKVILKNREGALFTALMQGDLGLAKGDVVEVAASGTGGGYVLHLLDVNKETAGPPRADMPGTLPGTMAMMKANPGLDPKSAAFLIENSIPVSAENIVALSNVVRTGSGLGELLAGILMGIREEDAMLEQQAAQSAKSAAQDVNLKNVQGETAKSGSTTETGSGTSASSAEQASAGESAAVKADITAGQSTAEAAAAAKTDALAGQSAAEAVDAIKADTSAVQGAAEAALGAALSGDAVQQAPDVQQPEVPGAQSVLEQSPQVDGKDSSAPQPASGDNPMAEGDALAGGRIAEGELPKTVPYNKEHILEKIRELFIKPEVQTGAELKKTVTEAEDNLRELKMMLDSSDTNNKKTYIDKAEQAIKQLELMSGTKRFEYIQLPFFLKNGSERTAELYVYRRPRKKEQGEEGLTVLVALDTQNIGRVETLIKTTGNAISLEFRLERKEIQQEITKRAKSLAKSLESAGYRLKSVRLTKLENRTTVLNAAGPPEEAEVKSGNVDVKI